LFKYLIEKGADVNKKFTKYYKRATPSHVELSPLEFVKAKRRLDMELVLYEMGIK